MKYILQVNQEMAIKLGIANIQQAIIFDLLSMSSTWAKPEIIDNKHYYWVARQHISRELPFLNLKIDSIYRHLKHLDKLGLIIYKKLGKKDCIMMTDKGKSYYVGNKSENVNNAYITMSEINPEKLGNKSEKDSEINPTYQTTITNQETILLKESTKEISKDINTKNVSNPINEVFGFWQETMKHPKAVLDNKRKTIISRALKLNYSVQDLKAAIIGCSCSAFHMGKNDQNKVFDDIGLILRDSMKIEGFMRDALSNPHHGETKEDRSTRMANEVIEMRKARSARMTETYNQQEEKEIGGIRL